MYKNYLKVFLRNISRQPVYTLINIAGLSIGIAATLFILLYLDFEMHYDRVHTQSAQIYRIETPAIKTHEKVLDVGWQTTPANLGPLVQQDYPEIGSFVRFFSFFSNIPRFKHGSTEIEPEPEQVIAVDASVFDVFSFDLIQGDPTQALQGPNKVVISENLAARIFGAQNPMGQVLETNLVHNLNGTEQNYPLEVTGVYRDLPENTHLYFQAMISAETDPELASYYFNRFNTSTYVLLHPQADPEAVGPKLTTIYEQYLDPNIDPVLVNARHELVPLRDIHLRESGGASYLYIFGGVGLLLLLIAFISYVNLVTAQAGRRALEIGLRKVLGSVRKQLVFQFLTESLAFTLLSLIIAVGLVMIFASPLNRFLDLHIAAEQLLQTRILLSLLGITILLGLIGGSYPAFFLSGFQPIAVIKGKLTQAAPLRKYLVSFQFTAVIFVLASTGMIYQQLRFLRNKDLGFNRDRVVQLSVLTQEASGKIPVLKAALQRDPNIQSVATCNFLPGIGGMIRRPVSARGAEAQFVRQGRFDYDYLETMDIEVVAGRNFSPAFPADSSLNTIINRTFAKAFELGDNPLGEEVRFGGKDNPRFFRIIGVIEDFHQSSLHAPIEPQMFLLGRNAGDVMIKISDDPAAAIGRLEKTWGDVFPDQAFTYAFLDDTLQNLYREDQKRGRIFLFFSGITLLISFAGLYGLAAYMTGQRTKEVGIRKVLGARISDIVFLLSKDFLRLVVIAALPGLLLAGYLIQQWLENFAFQTGINYFLFGLVLLSVFLLTFLTVGWHATRAALLNPKETLKNE